MKENEIFSLAFKIQLKIEKEKISNYLVLFEKINKLTKKLEELRISKKVKKMERINSEKYLKFSDLKKIYKQNLEFNPNENNINKFFFLKK